MGNILTVDNISQFLLDLPFLLRNSKGKTLGDISLGFILTFETSGRDDSKVVAKNIRNIFFKYFNNRVGHPGSLQGFSGFRRNLYELYQNGLRCNIVLIVLNEFFPKDITLLILGNGVGNRKSDKANQFFLTSKNPCRSYYRKILANLLEQQVLANLLEQQVLALEQEI